MLRLNIGGESLDVNVARLASRHAGLARLRERLRVASTASLERIDGYLERRIAAGIEIFTRRYHDSMAPHLDRVLEIRNELSSLYDAVARGEPPGPDVAPKLQRLFADLDSELRALKSPEQFIRDLQQPFDLNPPLRTAEASSRQRVVEPARPAEQAMDVDTINRWIEEEIAGVEPFGKEPISLESPAAMPPSPPPRSFREALDAVDISPSSLSPEEKGRLEAGYKRYVQKYGNKRRLRAENDYIRFIHGKSSRQLRATERPPRDLGARGAVEQEAGHVLQKVVNNLLPPGSANSRDFPTALGGEGVRPDHLPPGMRTVYLRPDGTTSGTPPGVAFSADYVGDSKYRDFVPTDHQTRGFPHLAALSDQKLLVFFVRWQEQFGEAGGLALDINKGGYILPDRFTSGVVQPGVLAEAARLGVRVQLVTHPSFR